MRTTCFFGRPHVHKRRGFTLVELLVVIGIIAILISILVPALSRSRDVANNIKCRSNLNQIGTALRLYTNDNRDHSPSPQAVGEPADRQAAAGFRRGIGEADPNNADLIETLGLPNLLNGTLQGNNGTPYLRSEGIWLCPNWAGQQSTQVEKNSYEFNITKYNSSLTSLQRGRLPKVAPLRTDGTPNPNAGQIDLSVWWYVRDNVSLGPNPTNAPVAAGTTLFWSKSWSYPHSYRVQRRVEVSTSKSQGAQNVLFFDGSVGTIVTKPGPGNSKLVTYVRGEP